MTSVSHTRQALRSAAAQAVLAPSVHNTQPWRFVIRGDTLEIHADWTRKLDVLDPTGRQLIISCGCALFNARVGIAAAGYDATVERLPDRDQPDLLARLTVPDRTLEQVPLSGLNQEIVRRHTNRRRFTDDPVPAEVVARLVSVANAEDTELFHIVRPEHRYAAASLSQHADQQQNADPAYRAELRAWTTDDPTRADGVPALAVPHVDGSSGDDLPIRDFDTRGIGWLPVETHSTIDQCLLLLATVEDNPTAWLRSGEALEHVLLEATHLGYAASPLTQVIEVAWTRVALQTELGMLSHPHVLLRVGRAPKPPVTRRRWLVNVLSEVVADRDVQRPLAMNGGPGKQHTR